VSAQEYHTRLISVCKRKIGAGQSFSLGSLLTSIDDKIVTEMRINMVSPKDRNPDRHPDDNRGGKGSKGGGKNGKGGKGGSPGGKSWQIKKNWIPSHQNRQDQRKSTGKGGKKGSGRFICFDHDPRNGKICKNNECLADPVKQHLDTKQPDLASRYDRALSMFEKNKVSGRPK